MKFKNLEIKHLLISTIVLAFVFSFREWGTEGFSVITGITNWILYILVVAIALILKQIGHKIVAKKYGASSEFRIWSIERYGLSKSKKFPKSFVGYRIQTFPLGLILSITLAFVSNGLIKFAAVTSSKIKEKYRLGKKFKNLTEFETAAISLAGPLTNLFLAIIFQITGNLFNFERFVIVNSALAMYSMIPLSKLDGSRIFFGSKILYLLSFIFIFLIGLLLPTITTTYAILALIMTAIILILIYFYKPQ